MFADTPSMDVIVSRAHTVILDGIGARLARRPPRSRHRCRTPRVLPCEFRVNKAKFTRQRKTIVAMLMLNG